MYVDEESRILDILQFRECPGFCSVAEARAETVTEV